MNKYHELKKAIEKDISDFPFMFAFNKEQFKEGMEKLGLAETDTKAIFSIGAGGYIRKTDSDALHALTERHAAQIDEAMKDDEYVFDGVLYELGNHEYGYTGNPEPALEALGLSVEEVKNDERLLAIFNRARNVYFKENEGNL